MVEVVAGRYRFEGCIRQDFLQLAPHRRVKSAQSQAVVYQNNAPVIDVALKGFYFIRGKREIVQPGQIEKRIR